MVQRHSPSRIRLRLLDEAKQRVRDIPSPIWGKVDRPPPEPKVILVEGVDVTSVEFLKTYAWRKARYAALANAGARCECCGARPTRDNDVILNVDHIKPRRARPDLALDPYNLQVLCADCNAGKGNWDATDWR